MQYVCSLNKDTPMKSIWKKFKKIDRKGTSLQQPILEENTCTIIDPKLVADNKIAQSLASISILDRYIPNFIRYKNIIESNNLSFNEAHISNYNFDFTIQELQEALANTKKYSKRFR